MNELSVLPAASSSCTIFSRVFIGSSGWMGGVFGCLGNDRAKKERAAFLASSRQVDFYV